VLSRAPKVLAQYRATILTSTLLSLYAQLLRFELHRLASPFFGWNLLWLESTVIETNSSGCDTKLC